MEQGRGGEGGLASACKKSEAQGLGLISQGSVLAVWPPAEAVRRREDHGYLSPSKPLDPGAVNCLSSHQSRFTPNSTLLGSASPCYAPFHIAVHLR